MSENNDVEAPAIDPVEIASELRKDAAENRAWLRAILPVFSAAIGPEPEGGLSARVRFAVHQAAIAAAERISRILRSDLPPADPP